MDKNQTRLVVGLAAALGCSLIAVAFLVGRLSAPTTADRSPAGATQQPLASEGVAAPTPATSAATTSLAVEIAPPMQPDLPKSEPAGGFVPAPSFQSLPPAAESVQPSAVEPTARTGRVEGGDRLAIAAYFSQIDRADDAGAGDPQAFAQSLMKSVASGDFSGFDELVGKARAQRDRLRGMTPPQNCAEHHRVALELAGESIAMLERMRGALQKNDTTALLSMASEGKTLEAKANQLKALGDALKKQAGI